METSGLRRYYYNRVSMLLSAHVKIWLGEDNHDKDNYVKNYFDKYNRNNDNWEKNVFVLVMNTLIGWAASKIQDFLLSCLIYDNRSLENGLCYKLTNILRYYSTFLPLVGFAYSLTLL